MRNKIIPVIISCLLACIYALLVINAFAEEQLTITTYYPSPNGVYNELQLYGHDNPTSTCDDAHKGTMYYDSDDNNVYVCKGAALGWVKLGGGGTCYTYYCTSVSGYGTPVCNDVGGTQGNCPVGFEQKQAFGGWGFCQYPGRDLEVFLIPGGTCSPGYSTNVWGSAYLCCQ